MRSAHACADTASQRIDSFTCAFAPSEQEWRILRLPGTRHWAEGGCWMFDDTVEQAS